MQVLVIGADEITPIKAVLKDLGAENIEHWDARNENRVNKKPIPKNVECIVMLTSFLNHNTMKKIKSEAKKRNLIIVLKGAYTATVLPKGDIYFNATGNAGMATAGSGDVLTGIITGLLAQGYLPAEAAVLGVCLHGLAGDLAAAELSEAYITAGDIVSYLGKARLKLERLLA